MSHANRSRLLKNTVFLYFRLVVIMGVSLYTSRIVLNALGIEDYGIHNVVAGAVSMVAFLNGAMATASQRFISFEFGKESSSDDLARVFTTSLLIHTAIALLTLIAGLSLGWWMVYHVLTIPEIRLEAAGWVLVCAVFTMVVHIILTPFTALILSRERMKIYAYMSILDAMIKLSIAYMLGVGGYDRLKLYAVLLFFGAVLMTGIYAIICKISFPECRIAHHRDWAKVRQMTSFVGWNISAHIAAMMGNQGVNVLLNIHFGPTVNAARGIAMQASGTLQGFVSNLQVASAPQIVKTYSAGEYAAERDLIVFSSKITLFLFLILGLPIFIEANQVLHLWLGKVPPNADLFLKLMIIKYIIDTSTTPLYQGIMATGKIKSYNFWVCASILSGFFVSWALLSSGSPSSAVFYVAIVVSLVLMTLRLVFLRAMISFSMRNYLRQILVIGMLIIICGGAIPLAIHLNAGESLQRLSAVFISSFVCLPIAAYFIGLNHKERSRIKSEIYKRLGPLNNTKKRF